MVRTPRKLRRSKNTPKFGSLSDVLLAAEAVVERLDEATEKKPPKPGLYQNCTGLRVKWLRDALSYNPETGILTWQGNYGPSGGGAQRGTIVDRSSLRIGGFNRNTFGVIYLLMLGRLPEGKVPFRDGIGSHWHWENIKPYEAGEEPAFTLQIPRTRRAK